MPQLTLRDITLGYGGKPLIENANLSIDRGQRLCLIGRNGVGKTSLFKLLLGELVPEAGIVETQEDLTIAALEQKTQAAATDTVYHFVAKGLGTLGDLLTEFEALTHKIAEDSNPSILDKLHEVQQKIDNANAWSIQQRVETVLSKLQLDPDMNMTSLSGGMLRRASLARALVTSPDVLLLDEPTNHLDIDTIIWLESFMCQYPGTIIFITHDRMLLKKTATDIIEIENGHLYHWEGTHAEYLKHKAEQLAAEEKAQQRFDKRLAQEEVWIRQGIKARRTRNEGRVRALKKMREEKAAQRKRHGKVSIKKQTSELSGKDVFEVENVSYAYEGKPIINNFSTLISRKDKIGIIGKNGSGKSTLLKLLVGELEPQSGTVRVGTKLNIGYFDQHQAELSDERSVADSVNDGSDFVTIAGRNIHVLSYLRDFLFSPERARQPIKLLSGGERNRLLLARLLARPCNVLILDEPTNDLDSDTLELLEERLLDYDGTLLLVSHDRSFLNNLVTSTIVFSEDGDIEEYVGGYDDYLSQRSKRAAVKPEVTARAAEKPIKSKSSAKLSYKEVRALESLPKTIEALEAELSSLHAKMGAPEFYQSGEAEIKQATLRVAEVEAELEAAYESWQALEAKSQKS